MNLTAMENFQTVWPLHIGPGKVLKFMWIKITFHVDVIRIRVK